MWEGETTRFLTIDRQRDHQWVVCRAWRSDGASRLIWEGKVQTSEDVEALRAKLGVKRDLTFQDAQFETGHVYDECARFGWVGLHGSQDDGFMHFPRNGRQ